MDNTSITNDQALWEAASSGDVNAEETLVEKYTRQVRICARPFFLAGADSEDLIQEGMMGLLSAVRQYDPSRDASFKTYAELCIRNRLYTAIKSAARSKHTPLNDYVSLESPLFDESQTHVSSFLRDPEELIIARERFGEIMESMRGSLSKFESKILGFYLEGLSYNEIAAKVARDPKSVDNAVQRIRKKLAQFH